MSPEEPSLPTPRDTRIRRAEDTSARPPMLTVRQGDRLKAYRPIPADARRAALRAGLAAYRRGEFFDAHELLEPAWMGTDDLLERALYQGLIKLAAAYVHYLRANPRGMVNNLRGARSRLGDVVVGDGPTAGLDVAAIIRAIDRRLAALEAGAEVAQRGLGPPRLRRAPGIAPARGAGRRSNTTSRPASGELAGGR